MSGRQAGVAYYTSGEAARRLGVTIRMIKHMIKDQRLVHVSENGRYYFPCDALHRFAETYEPCAQQQSAPKERERLRAAGTCAQSVFRCFAKGLDVRDTVLETGYAPETVRRLWTEWNTSLEAGEKRARALAIEKAEQAAAKQAEKERAAKARAERREAYIAAKRLEQERARREEAEAQAPKLAPWRAKLRGNGEVIPFARKACEDRKA